MNKFHHLFIYWLFFLLLFKKHDRKELFFFLLSSIIIVVSSFVLFIFLKEDSINSLNEFSNFRLILLSIINILYFFEIDEEKKLENNIKDFVLDKLDKINPEKSSLKTNEGLSPSI